MTSATRTLYLFAALALAAIGTAAQEAPDAGNANAVPAPSAAPQVVRGWQLMTTEERQHYQATMRSLATPEERSRLRAAIHEAMKLRAQENGVTLPDQVPAGAGMGLGGRGRQCAGVDAAPPAP